MRRCFSSDVGWTMVLDAVNRALVPEAAKCLALFGSWWLLCLGLDLKFCPVERCLEL